MTIQVGDKIPSVLLKQLGPSGLHDVSTDALFGGKKVILFAIPGAFTPTCTARHLPGYISLHDEFQKRGIEIVCLAVNDPFVMSAWIKLGNAEGVVTPLADGNGTFTKALDLEMDGSAYALGIRCKRFALYAENGVIKILEVEKPGAFEVSAADYMLKRIG